MYNFDIEYHTVNCTQWDCELQKIVPVLFYFYKIFARNDLVTFSDEFSSMQECELDGARTMASLQSESDQSIYRRIQSTREDLYPYA